MRKRKAPPPPSPSSLSSPIKRPHLEEGEKEIGEKKEQKNASDNEQISRKRRGLSSLSPSPLSFPSPPQKRAKGVFRERTQEEERRGGLKRKREEEEEGEEVEDKQQRKKREKQEERRKGEGLGKDPQWNIVNYYASPVPGSDWCPDF